MTRETLIHDISLRIAASLQVLDDAGIPGSVHTEIHRDSSGVRKVLITTQEAWSIREKQ